MPLPPAGGAAGGAGGAGGATFGTDAVEEEVDGVAVLASSFFSPLASAFGLLSVAPAAAACTGEGVTAAALLGVAPVEAAEGVVVEAEGLAT